MTLVEVMVALVIALIVIGITSTMLISGTQFFNKASSEVQDAEIARTVLNFTKSELRFATEIRSYIITSDRPNPKEGEGVLFAMNESGAAGAYNRGMIGFRRPDDKQLPARNIFGKDFYHGRTVGIRIQCLDAEQPKVIKIFVDVFADNKLVATDSATIEVPNISNSSQPMAEHPSPPENHAYIIFSVLQ